MEVELKFQSETRHIEFVTEVSDSLSKLVGFNETDRHRIALAVSESVANAVRHGNQFDTHKEVQVTFTATSDALQISVSDQGDGFDHSSLPDPRAPENLHKPGGRGVFIILNVMDSVGFNRMDGSMEVWMEKRLNL
ncbi:ATP-binding protein [Microbulbifer taiwanensis]|uniref:ATP-binding protein n=1 Tax=Microbulbifer taiwanensis TaxID=986746 RepID=A0ABW1YQ58_9GAMM|nr:ATP-binding protein [Microbulbifer taiwanensis]